jgi:hypothetical protein
MTDDFVDGVVTTDIFTQEEKLTCGTEEAGGV